VHTASSNTHTTMDFRHSKEEKVRAGARSRFSRTWKMLFGILILATAAECAIGQTVTASSRSGNCFPGNEAGHGEKKCLRTGTIYWGADGHRDKPGVYQDVPLSQQIADLKNIFGNTPNTIFYSAWDSIIGHESDVTELQAAGIIPIVSVITYPDWYSFSSESDAYNWAYSQATEAVKAAPTAMYWKVGNEWNSQWPIANEKLKFGELASDWNTAPHYPIYRGAAAGAIAAIRDNNPHAKIIAGAITGWTPLGFADALAADLVDYNGRDLLWDFTNLHWYMDVASDGTQGDSGDLGVPDSYFVANWSPFSTLNAYSLLYPAMKPLFIDELGSSDGNVPANDVEAGVRLTNLMDNVLSHTNPSSTERGVVGATIYQLYQMPFDPKEPNDQVETGYFLYNYPAGGPVTIAPQGKAVKEWIARHNDPTYNNKPTFSLSGGTGPTLSPGTTATATITLTPIKEYHGDIVLTCSVQSLQYAGAPDTPTCAVPGPVSLQGSAPVTATITISADPATSGYFYDLTVVATGRDITADTNVIFIVN